MGASAPFAARQRPAPTNNDKGGALTMDALFLTTGGQAAINNAYSPDCQQILSQELRLLPPVYSKQALLDNAQTYQTASYLFSTWGMLPLTEEEIEALFPALKAVFYAAGSVQAFARPFLSRGVSVFSAWAANGVPVAEYAFAQIILGLKGFFRSSVLYKAGQAEAAREVNDTVPGVYGVQVGLLGAGMIGKMLIERLHTVNVQLLVFDPFLSPAQAQALGVRKAQTLEEVFASCQLVSNHLANNADTKAMLRYEHFSLLPPNAVFLNTGRHAQIDEPGFLRFLAERPDVCAVLDVTDPHEPLPSGHPLYSLPNVTLTPHIAGSLGLEVRRMGEYMLAEYQAFSKGLPTRYSVSLEMLKTMA